MKKLWIGILCAMLLLTACANQNVEPTTEPTTVPVETEPPGLYVPDSAVEGETSGAVRLYELGRTGYCGVSAVGDRLLLLSGTDQTQLELFSGDACVPSESAVMPVNLQKTAWQVTYTGIVYYDEPCRQAVYLDTQLKELHRMDVPQDMEGLPVFSADGNEMFYCVGQEIRGFDTQREVSRLIKSHSCASQTLLGSYFEDKLLGCSVEDAAGNRSLLYISAENGASVKTDTGVRGLSTYEDSYFALRMDGTTAQQLVGRLDGTPAQLNVPEGQLWEALQLGGILGYSADESGKLHLSFYDMTTGQKTASVSLSQTAAPIGVYADRWSGCIWLLLDGEETQQLLRWNIKSSSVTEDVSYLGAVYTKDAPDTEGLAALQERVNALNKQHGTAIRIWQEAVKTPGSYTLEPEYQVSAIEESLNRLEPVLAQFPEDFLRKSASSKIRICIARTVDGEATSMRYWDNGDAYIVLPAGIAWEQDLILALSYVVDSHILGNSPLLDAWEGLNPEGFSYGADTQWDPGYLEGENRVFADGESMKSVSDDRARIFWQAMQPDNGQMFASPTMQAKLLLLCQSIRDAWRWERKTETYPWEQYLTESIAYVKR